MTPSTAGTTTRTLLIAVIQLAALAATLPAAVVNAPASGALEAPRGAVSGELTATAAATDPDGLYKVSLVFVGGGTPLVLCHDEDPTKPCTGTFGSWTRSEIDPSLYGVAGDGPLTIGLWVEDERGWVSLVARETIDYSFPLGNSPWGQIIAPAGSYAGEVTVRAVAGDPSGLARVSVKLGPGAAPVVLCDPCSGTSGDFVRTDVDPAAYGALAGSIQSELWVRDAGGSEQLVATHVFDWQPVAGSDPSGHLTSPNDLVTGEVMISAGAGDPDGLDRVAVRFDGGGEHVLCEGVADPCLGYLDSWRDGGVDPGQHGVSGAGPVLLELAVDDDQGTNGIAVEHTFDWQPASLRGSTGTINGVTDNPDGTIDVAVTAGDPDGLYRVDLRMVPRGTPVVLCAEGGPPCGGSLSATNVDPRAYGATGGTITLELWVGDDTGRYEWVDDHSFPWTPPPTPEGVLSVTPASDVATSGEEGGPFGSLPDYTLENIGDAALDYGVTIAYDPVVGAWLNANNLQGTLTPAATIVVQLSINGTVADSLGQGVYTATLSFENQTNGLGDTERTVTLTVNPAQQLPPRIEGRITDGAGNPIEGVRIDGMPVVHWSDADGRYGRVVGEGWSGTVSPHKAGYTFTPPSRSYTNVTESFFDQDYTGTLSQFTIEGRITLGGQGLAGVTLDGLPGPPTTDAGGNYAAGIPFGFTGTVTPSKAGHLFTPSSRVYDDVRMSQYGEDYAASAETVVLSGTVTLSGSGLAGVWLSGLPGGITTTGDGSYEAAVPLGWSGTVTPSKTGYAFDPPSRIYAGVAGGEPGDYTATVLPAGSNRLWIVSNDAEMFSAMTWNEAGDMVLVKPGTYTDARVDRLEAGVTMISEGGAEVTSLEKSYEHRFISDDLVVDGFTFESTSGDAVWIAGNRVQIRNSRFRAPVGEWGLRLDFSASDAVLEQNVFDAGSTAIVQRSGSATGDLVIRNSEFRNIRGLGGGSNPSLNVVLENNVFTGSGQDGVDLNGVQSLTLRNNVFTGLGWAVDSQSIPQVTIAHNVFYNNTRALHLCSGSFHFYNSILQSNATGVDGCTSATVTIDHVAIWQGTWLWAGPIYILDDPTIWRDVFDPQFLNPAGGDFHLAAGSLARSRGTGSSDLGAYGGSLGNAWVTPPGTPQSPPALLTVEIGGLGALNVGDTVQLSADGDFENGYYSPLTEHATWSSSNESVLRTLGGGRFEALVPGTSTVTASYGGKTDQLLVTVLDVALVLAATDAPDPVFAGDSLAYTLSWRNDGPGIAKSAVLTATWDPGTTNPVATTPPDAGTDNVWTLGDLAAGSSGTVAITVDVGAGLTEGTVLSFAAALDSDHTAPLNAGATTVVAGRSDLAVTKTSAVTTAYPGDLVTYVLTYANNGTGTATDVQLVDSYPSGVSFVTARPLPSSGTNTWALGELAPGAAGSVEVDVRIDDATVGDVVNQAEILAAEPDAAPADNDDAWAVEVLPRADLAVALGAEPDPVPSGGELTYTVTVDNAGPSVATAVVVDHVLPNEAKVNGAPAGSGWTCTVATDAGVATVTCERPSLAAETSSTISVVVAAPLTPGTATSSAQVAAATEDSDLSNNVAERSVSVEEPLPATILLVDDDDDSPDVMSYYTAALDVLGFGYDIWDTGASDLEPDAATLSQYEVVIWFTGAHSGGFAGPGPAAESALGQYLDAGGCLFVSSQDYLWDRGGSTHDVPTPLMSDYLGMASGSSDVRHSTVTGSGADFGVLGSHTLAFPYSNFSDRISPDASAQLGWSGDQGDAGIAKSAGGYRTTFWGFGFEAVPTAVDREDVMAAVLLFCADVGGIFADGFESGNWSAWSSVVGGARTSPAGR